MLLGSNEIQFDVRVKCDRMDTFANSFELFKAKKYVSSSIRKIKSEGYISRHVTQSTEIGN